MLDDDQVTDTTPSAPAPGDEPAPAAAEDAETPPPKKRTRKAPAKKAAAEPMVESPGDAPVDGSAAVPDPGDEAGDDAPSPAKKAPAKRASRSRTKKAAEAEQPSPAVTLEPTNDQTADEPPPPARKGSRGRKAEQAEQVEQPKRVEEPAADEAATGASEQEDEESPAAAAGEPQPAPGGLVFQAPEPVTVTRRSRRSRQAPPTDETTPDDSVEEPPADAVPAESTHQPEETEEPEETEAGDDLEGGARRRRRRGGRRRRKSSEGTDETDGPDATEAAQQDEPADETADQTGSQTAEPESDSAESESPTSRRRRRRRRTGEEGDDNGGDDAKPAARARKSRNAEDEITSVQGSTRLEAKKQRRREGREAGRRRAPIVSEAEFLARRESVERVMAIRQRDDTTQIAVLEDKVLVEHYVARESQTSLIGNVYLGRVQNVLPSMEAAFVDIGKGRNAVLYAGEVNWSALGHKEGQARKIESVLSSGQPVLVQVTKDPVGHKGARLTSQISLAGRFLVYVPDGTTSGISRKLPDTERHRLKTLLKEIVPDTAGVIVRTAAEGAAEDELTRDVERLKARWEDIERKAKGNAPQLLYGEPDLTLKVVRDLFTEDFTRLLIEGDDAWDTVQQYVLHVAPDLEERLERYDAAADQQGRDLFTSLRIEEQIHKGLDRKVWLPSGGSLVIDRTEAMTVVDVNTGKFTGSGGNLEETVTKNNLEAAEEMVRQLRLRDIGGIIVIDFIDMVLESNRDLVLRRLVECLGRDRTRHQVAEVTSLGLVQMTRKRIGSGLLEVFSENCEHCNGRGVVIKDAPVEPKRLEDSPRGTAARGRGRGRGGRDVPAASSAPVKPTVPSPLDIAAVARAENADRSPVDGEAAEAARGESTLPQAEPLAGIPGAPDDQPPAPPPSIDAPRPPAEAEQVTEDPDLLPAEPTVEAEPVRAAEPVVAEPVAAEPAVAEAVAVDPVVAEPEAPAASTAPRVVTRTRRRAASRPAGPPMVTLPQVAQPSGLDFSAEGTAVAVIDGVEGEDAHTVEHVPIKKRGARKR